MNVHVASTQTVAGLSRLQSVNSLSTGDGSTSPISVSSGEDSIELSGPGELLSKLQELQEADPEKFKEVCADIAEQLSAAAEEAGDTRDGRMLSDLAAKFQDVSEGGEISQLQPPPPPPPPGNAEGMVAQYSRQDTDAISALLEGEDTDMSSAADPMKEQMDSIISQIEEALSSAEA